MAFYFRKHVSQRTETATVNNRPYPLRRCTKSIPSLAFFATYPVVSQTLSFNHYRSDFVSIIGYK